MIEIGGKVDQEHMSFLAKYNPVAVLPCPIVRGRIHPNTTKGLLADGRLVYIFDVGPMYYMNRAGKWRPLTEVASHVGNKKIVLNENWSEIHPNYLNWLLKRQALYENGGLFIPSPYTFSESPMQLTKENILFTSYGPFYPDANPETSTVDGLIYNDSVGGATWALRRSSGTGAGKDDSSASSLAAYTDAAPQLWRSVYLFDSSSIADGETVDSGTFSVYTTAPSDTNSNSLCLTQSNPASNTALATTDFGLTRDSLNGGTEGATRVTFASMSGTAYRSMTLTATGLGWVSKTGITKFGLTNSGDMDNSAPSGSNGFTSANYADNGTNKPKLEVVATSAATTPSLMLLMGVGA